jgi:hypothetical protein
MVDHRASGSRFGRISTRAIEASEISQITNGCHDGSAGEFIRLAIGLAPKRHWQALAPRLQFLFLSFLQRHNLALGERCFLADFP